VGWRHEDGGPRRTALVPGALAITRDDRLVATSRVAPAFTMVVAGDDRLYALRHTAGEGAVALVERIDPVEHEGAAAALAGDGVPCPGLDALCQGADLYVRTVIREDLVRAIPSPRLQDILDYHSTVEQAAQTAARAGVRTLVLTHYVPPPTPGDEGAWRALAEAHFTGEIVLGNDLTTVAAGSGA
jgi:ribonuclease BN (tRNA processing enzyme)